MLSSPSPQLLRPARLQIITTQSGVPHCGQFPRVHPRVAPIRLQVFRYTSLSSAGSRSQPGPRLPPARGITGEPSAGKLNSVKPTSWHLERDQDFVYRVSRPDEQGHYPIALLLHGRSGNENSMEVFVPTLPESFLKVCPRGILPDEDGGYTWHPRLPNRRWPELRDFDPAIASLARLMRSVQERHSARVGQMIVIGFSQGAALGCAFTLGFPAQVKALVLLAGFVPDIPPERKSERVLRDKPVFVAHGIEDPLVPISLAQKGAQSLEELGAHVNLCKTPAGHKVGADCLRALSQWFNRLPA